MRPYKKRSFTNIQVQAHNDNNEMETENSEDSDTQASPPSAPESAGEKEKEGDVKIRKKWKRKISRKQFRHHNIKLFTPGEYRSSTLLKQKEPPGSPTLLKKVDVSKEAITDAIVTTLGGVSLQRSAKIKEHAIEENNNNTHGFHNPNSMGKHHLPAIIMETPPATRRRSLENVQVPPKPVFMKQQYPPTSGDLPVLQSVPQESHRETSSKTTGDVVQSKVPITLQRQGMEITENGLENMQRSEGDEQPENLSLKRRCSVEVPVDLSKRTTSHLGVTRAEFQNKNSQNGGPHKLSQAVAVPQRHSFEERAIARPAKAGHRASPDLVYSNKYLQEMELKRILKVENLTKNMDLLQRLLGQEFNVHSLDLMAQAYQQVEESLDDLAIYPDMRYKARKMHEEVYNFINGKMKYELGLNLDVLEVIKILGRSENNQAKSNLQTNLEEIQRLRNLNLNDCHSPRGHPPLTRSVFVKPHSPHHQHLADVPQVPSPNFMDDYPHVQRRHPNVSQQGTYQQILPVPPSFNIYPASSREFVHQVPLFHPPPNNLFSGGYSQGGGRPKEGKRNVTPLGRPRSKSHRIHEHPPSPLKRSLSNPLTSPLPPYTPEAAAFHLASRLAPVAAERVAFNDNHPPLQYLPEGHVHEVNGDAEAKYRNSCPAGYPGQSDMDGIQTHVGNVRKVPNRIPINVNIPVEESISSTTDHLEDSKGARRVVSMEVFTRSVPEKLTERPKTLPAVIVADTSMQIEITKDPSSDRSKPQEPVLDPNKVPRTTVITSSSSEASSEELFKRAVDEENTPEFLIWLEKLKKNEKLKSKFLTQMGITKKEAASTGDCIEIIDSDDEKFDGDLEDTKKNLQPILPSPSKPCAKISHEFKRSSSLEITPVPPSVKNITPPPHTLKPSLSTINYIPPISLPYPVPPDTIASKLTKDPQKSVYSPEIEPISPVSETNFHFPQVVPSTAKVVPAPMEHEVVMREPTRSPSYASKRKTPQGFSEDYSCDVINRKSSEYPSDNLSKRRKSLDRPQTSMSPRVAPSGKLCYIRENHMFLRYFDDTQVELFIKNLSSQDEELLRTTGIDPDRIKNSFRPSSFHAEQLTKTEIVHLPNHVEFSRKEDLPDVEEFVKESSLVEQFVPKDFADFYRYVTGFQIIKNKHPVSLKTFLTMYNTNRTSELLRKYLQRLDEDSPAAAAR